MRQTFDNDTFSEHIRTARRVFLQQTLRETAKSIGISAATLGRCEQGKTPELITFIHICNWLNQPMTKFVVEVKNKKRSK